MRLGIGDWGLGVWGLGFGGQPPKPTTKAPTPKPKLYFLVFFF